MCTWVESLMLSVCDVIQTVGYPAMSQSYSSNSAQQNLTPVQQHVVQQYIHQKTQSGTGQNYAKKKVYAPPQNQQSFYCDICKISCASALVMWSKLVLNFPDMTCSL
jgi:hypothetical protein